MCNLRILITSFVNNNGSLKLVFFGFSIFKNLNIQKNPEVILIFDIRFSNIQKKSRSYLDFRFSIFEISNIQKQTNFREPIRPV